MVQLGTRFTRRPKMLLNICISRTRSWNQDLRMWTFLREGQFFKSGLGSHWRVGRRSRSSMPIMSRRIHCSGRCLQTVKNMFYPSPPFLLARKMLWPLFQYWRQTLDGPMSKLESMRLVCWAQKLEDFLMLSQTEVFHNWFSRTDPYAPRDNYWKSHWKETSMLSICWPKIIRGIF